jgi:hypothetical protein
MKKQIIVVLLISVLAVLFVRACIMQKVTRINDAGENQFAIDSDTYSRTAPHDYADLLNANDQLKIDRTDQSKRRNPIVEYFYKNKFYLQVYKIDTLGNVPIDRILKENFVSTEVSFNTDYVQFENSIPFMINYKLEAKPRNISNIYFTIFGSDSRIIKKNGNVAYYYSRFENFSISYNKAGSKDIYGNLKDSFEGKAIPCEIMFLKRNGNLYYILLAATDDKLNLDADMLNNLIKRTL